MTKHVETSKYLSQVQNCRNCLPDIEYERMSVSYSIIYVRLIISITFRNMFPGLKNKSLLLLFVCQHCVPPHSATRHAWVTLMK